MATSGFATRVIAWQRSHGRHDLPWQDTRDAYRIWLSEIMLQQTQVATVLPYYLRFIEEFPAVERLAAAPLGRVLELWSGLGYYRRAHHLHAAAKAVVREHAGRFPSAAITLTTLPGIGRSTAAAIAAFAAGERGAILDGNVKRVLARHRGVEGWPGEPRVGVELWRIADELLPGPEGDIAAYTQGLMDLGATICSRTRPRCDRCPVNADCIARRDARVAELPASRPRGTLPQRAVSVLLLTRDGRLLLERRPPLGVWSGLWSLPEMPVATDVEAYAATRFSAAVAAPVELPAVAHAFTHFHLTMHPLRVTVTQWPASLREPDIAWVDRDAALAWALPSPIRKLLKSLEPL